MKLDPSVKKSMIETAEHICRNAYAPYSNFFVGAVIQTDSGNIYKGCNVENASYGLTICAERNAIFNAIATEGPEMRIKAVVVANQASISCSPCGACRQVIAEFCNEDTIIIYNNNGKYVENTISDLLPNNFKFSK